ncbi:Neuroligin-4, X-linked [Cladorrhinum sp. PSN259]|nr:Neuroligin-4, X-linked [Cladorrhinum sp. PSN259]
MESKALCSRKRLTALIVAGAIFAAHTTQALYVGGGLTILSTNNLDGAENDKSAAILINQPSPNYASKISCQLLGEEPWNPDTANFKTTLNQSLPYHAYLDLVPPGQSYWIAKRTPDDDACRAIDAAGNVRDIDCGSELPTLCTQSAAVSSGKVNNNSPSFQVQQFIGNKLVTGYRDYQVWKFRGLRYADKPERFAYSKAASYEESGEIDATNAGADCSQPIGEVKNGSSEDCLFANVWTPYLPRMGNQDKTEQLKPVMLYLYGGGLTSGSGKNPNTDGTNLASRGDVVVVSINYRVGTLGFLNLNDGIHKGNYGISDMVTALEWVQKYIKFFGGDANRVTLFGESAGALGTHIVLSSPKAKGLFHRAILQSSPDGYPGDGTFSLAPMYDSLSNNFATTTTKVLKDAGCLNATDKISCLGKFSGFELVNLNTNANGVVQDGTYLTTSALQVSSPSLSQSSNVSVMLGITRDEVGVLVDDAPSTNTSTTFASYFDGLASKNFGLPPNTSSTFNLPPAVTSQLSPDAIFNSSMSLFTSLIFTCPSLAKAYSASRHGTFKEVYFFSFNRTYQTSGYTRPWCIPPKTASYPNGDPNLEYYKCHAGEQMVVFGSVARAGLPDRDGNDNKFQRLVVDYWASFARTGKPDPDSKYLEVRGLSETKKEVERVGQWEPVEWKSPKMRILQWGGTGIVGFGDYGQKETCPTILPDFDSASRVFQCPTSRDLKMLSEKRNLKVVIVGAGVAGLTLANALEKAGVDYLLLERHKEIAPQIGASIGIFASGARILDQLGVWKDVEAKAEIIRIFYSRTWDGRLINADDSSSLIAARAGYFNSWGERRVLLQTLYDGIKDHSKILVGKNLVRVIDEEDGATAVCDDGTSYRADIIVGCDGVRSKIRQKIWELSEEEYPELVNKDKTALHADYRAVFGIAHNIHQVTPGDFDVIHGPGHICFTVGVEGGKFYWYMGERYPKPYPSGTIPRGYSTQDTNDFLTKYSSLVIRPESAPGAGDALTIADIWANSSFYCLVPIEEGTFHLWHHGRLVCAGDAVHKATPNLGLGGNTAIESAAALANGIVALDRRAKSFGLAAPYPTKSDIEKMLAEYQKKRKPRADEVVKASDTVTKAHTLYSWLDKILVFYILPRFDEFIPAFKLELMVGSEKIDFLPLPEKSLRRDKVLAPFNPMIGVTKQESKLWRAVLALPLLAMAGLAFHVMDVSPVLKAAKAMRDAGKLVLSDGEQVGVLRRFYGLEGLDDFIAEVNMFFVPGMYGLSPQCRRQMLTFITEGTTLLLIWTFESTRRANGLNILQFPNLFTLLGQIAGIGVLSPLWCYIQYVLSPVERFAARDQRLTRTHWSFASLPAILIAYLLPFYGLFMSPELETRQSLLYIWQLYPVYLSAALWFISRFFKNTEKQDRLTNTEKDLPVMKWYIGAGSLLGASMWISTTWPIGAGIVENFVPTDIPGRGFNAGTLTFQQFIVQFMRWDQVFGFGSHLLWMAYQFWDLKAAGMLQEGWLKVVGLMVLGVPVIGPGATLGLAWLFRENILAHRTHKGALTMESVKRLHGKTA